MARSWYTLDNERGKAFAKRLRKAAIMHTALRIGSSRVFHIRERHDEVEKMYKAMWARQPLGEGASIV